VLTTCPLCSASPSGVIHTFTPAEVADVFTPSNLCRAKYGRMVSILEDMWRRTAVKVVKCDACEFCYADPFVAGTSEFYNLEAPDTPYPRNKWEYRHTLQELGRCSGAGSTLLDVGAGKGYFLSQLIGQGWEPRNLMAAEFSTSGRGAIERLGVECHQGDIRTLETDRRFDAVCMFQVLEHLDGYDELFAAVSRLSKPDGHLFLAVPNGARIDFNERLGLVLDLPPNHISRWTPRSIQILADKYGWTVESCELEPEASVVQDVAYAAVHRFIRDSHLPRSWAKLVFKVADRHLSESGMLNKAVKTFGMMVSPSVWLTSARAAYEARNGGIPHALWAHLRKKDEHRPQ
jgi:SAM-dependent methyltransferase